MKTATALAGLSIAAMLLMPQAPAGAAWWDDAYPYRRELTVLPNIATKLPGDDIAVMTMSTGGLTRSDAADVRVTTVDAKELPTRVLRVGPGDFVRVAWALEPEITKYYVYFGNARPAATTAGALDIRRGVLLEMWDWKDTPIKTLDQVKKLVGGSQDLIGRDFRDRIFQAYNPFGPQGRVACLYTGFLNITQKTQYTFSCSSQDASFVLIDDKLVLDNGGAHRVFADARKQAELELDAGLHKVLFYQACAGGDPVAVLAWKVAGGAGGGPGGFKPVPAEAFAPVASATVGPIEDNAKGAAVDFTPTYGGETFVSDRYFERFEFEAFTWGKVGGSPQLSWDFGDGQKTTGKRVEHVYLVNGDYTVKLTVKTADGTFGRTNRIHVSRPWDKITQDKLDRIVQHAEIVAKYDFAALTSEANGQAIVLLHRANTVRPLVRCGEAFVARTNAAAKSIQEVMPLLVEVLLQQQQAEQAAAALVKASKLTSDPAVGAAMLHWAARITLDELGDVKKAQGLFEAVLNQYGKLTAAPELRLARIGVGDCWRAQGDYQRAQEAYQAATPRTDPNARTAVQKGSLARHVEDHLRQKNLDFAKQFLDQWEQTFPLDKLEGYSTVMRVKYLLAMSSFPQAAREARALVKANPTSNYAPELLTLAADAYQRAAQGDKAREALKQLVESYPESPLAAQAAKRLKG